MNVDLSTKHYQVFGNHLQDYDKAEAYAKRIVGNRNNGYAEGVIYESVAIVKQPVPEAEVVKL